MATHSSVLAWRIPGMGEPGGLPSMGSHRVGHEWSDLAAAAAHHKRFLNKDNGNRKLLALLMKIGKTILDDSADLLKSHNFIDIMPHDVKLRVITLPLHPNHSNTNYNYKGLDNDINIWLWHCLPSKLSPHTKL